MEGWIKLHRKMVNWEWYQDCNVKAVFLHLLIFASHTQHRYCGRVIERGSLITSLASLSESLGLTVSQIRTALSKLERTGEIRKENLETCTLLHIVNYELYQGSEGNYNIAESQASDKPFASSSQTFSKSIASYNNDNNYNNAINDKTLQCGCETEVFPSEFIDGYDEDGYSIDDYKPTCFTKHGKGVVYMSTVQQNLLLDEIGDFRILNDYIEKLADFIIDNNAKVKNHYETIRRWWREDSGL